MRKSNPSSNLAAAAVAILLFSSTALGQDPNQVSQLICDPSSVTSGMATTCTVTLTAAAPAGGTEVLLSSNNALLPVTVGSLNIPAGSSSATFAATAGPIGSSQSATLTATALPWVMLSWTGSVSPNVTNYNVYRSSGGPYNFISNVGMATSYADYNVQNGQSYYYVTTAIDNTGQESVYSNQAVATVPIGVSQSATASLVGQSANARPIVTKVGVFRNGNSFLEDSNGNRQYDTTDTDITTFIPPGGFKAGDLPVTGDWTGNGHWKVGIYRPSTGTWWLDANNDGVLDAGDFTYQFGGIAGDVPVVGDWTFSGKSCIGIFRHGFFWVLDLNCNGAFDDTPTDAAFPFGGLTNDVPVVRPMGSRPTYARWCGSRLCSWWCYCGSLQLLDHCWMPLLLGVRQR